MRCRHARSNSSRLAKYTYSVDRATPASAAISSMGTSVVPRSPKAAAPRR